MYKKYSTASESQNAHARGLSTSTAINASAQSKECEIGPGERKHSTDGFVLSKEGQGSKQQLIMVSQVDERRKGQQT